MSNENEVVKLVSDLANMTVERMNTVETPFSLEDLITASGLFYACAVRWAIKDNPEVDPEKVAGTFFENLRQGLNYLVTESKNGAANDE